jgi:hypothetical protein
MWTKGRVKSTIFWDITPCSSLKVNRRFGGTYHLHLQGRISRARYQQVEITVTRGVVFGELPVCCLLEVSVINVMFVLRNKHVARYL